MMEEFFYTYHKDKKAQQERKEWDEYNKQNHPFYYYFINILLYGIMVISAITLFVLFSLNSPEKNVKELESDKTGIYYEEFYKEHIAT